MCFSRRPTGIGRRSRWPLCQLAAVLLFQGMLATAAFFAAADGKALAQAPAEEPDAEYQAESDQEPAPRAPAKKAAGGKAKGWRTPSISKNSLAKPDEAADRFAENDPGQDLLEPLTAAPRPLAQTSES